MANDRNATPRHAAKHAAPAPTARSAGSHAAPTRRASSEGVSAGASRVRIADRSGVEQQVRASRSTNASSLAGERRLSGANRPSYGRRTRETKTSRGPLVIIGVAALAVVLILFFLVRGCISSAANQIEPNEEVEPQEVQTTTDDVVTFQGVTFSIDTSTTPAQVVFQEADGGTSGTLFELEGTPVALMLYNGIIVVPEDLGDSWDIMAYTLGNDSLPTKVVGPDGNPITGTGDIVEATLDGAVVHVTDSTGATVDVSLV